MDSGIVFIKIIGHGDDIVGNLRCIRAVFQDNKTLTQMFLAGGVILCGAPANFFHHGFYRDGILFTVFHAFYAANGIRMPLADALAPKRIGFALRQNAVHIQAVEGEQAGIPTDGNHAHFAGSF